MATAADPSYPRIIADAMAKNGVKEPAEVICALLYLLRDHHTSAIWSDTGKHFNDGFDGITGKHAISPADSLRNLAVVISLVHQKNAENALNQNPGTDLAHLQFLASRIRCLADVLSAVIPAWEEEGEQLRARIEQMPHHVSPREGDSILEPWEGRPVDFEGNPVDKAWDGRTTESEEPPEE